MGGYGDSVIGKVRVTNEDSFLVENDFVGVLPNLYIVADGMGGHLAGEVASEMAVKCVKQFLSDYQNLNSSGINEAMAEAVNYANKNVYLKAAGDARLGGMGTTLTAVTVVDNAAYIVNVGDSRLYAVTEGTIKQITVDHSYVMELVLKGQITIEEAEYHPNKNIITRAVGTGPDVKPDTFIYELKENDMLLLCTDGLSNMLTDNEIKEICKARGDKALIVERLISAANEKGGIDNISVVLYGSGEGDK